MANTPFHSPYDYGHHRVTVFSPSGRFADLDISLNVSEVSFFEAINQPYVSGQIMIADSSNISNHVNFMGQEYIRVEMFTTDGTLFIDKTFVVTGVQRQAKANDHASVIILSFIEEHVIASEITRISKTFEGKPEVVAATILSEINKQTRFDTSFQDQLRYIAPYTHKPLDMAKELVSKASTINGAPFYMYSTLNDDNMIIESLETMLGSAKVYNQTFNYGVASGNVEGLEINTAGRQIKTMSIANNEENTRMFKHGAFGSQYLWLDTNKSIPTELRYRYNETIEKMPRINGTVNYDGEFVVNEKPFHEGVSDMMAKVTTGSLFDGIVSLDEQLVADDHMKRAEANALRASLGKSQMDITVPGYHLMNGNQVTGRMIEIYVPKNVVVYGENNHEQVSDKKLSGSYLIFGTRHQFKDTKYTAVMNITKYDNKKSISQEQVNNV